MRRCHSTRADPDQGFTILEIMVAVVIIGILVAIAVPIYLHLQRNSQNSRFISDLRTFSQAYETYAMTYGKWPPSAASGVVPTGLSGELQDSHWAVINSLVDIRNGTTTAQEPMASLLASPSRGSPSVMPR